MPSHFQRPFGRSKRGFTLMELMAVVVIIAIFAAVSVPVLVRQMRDRRVQEAARRVALLYQQARLRAMGRGTAVLVRFTGGAFQVREARMGARHANAACADLPFSSCLTNTWNDADQYRVVDAQSASASGEDATLTYALTDSLGNNRSDVDICFTAMGRTFVRHSTADADTLTTMQQAYTATIQNTQSGLRPRHVLFLPNGTARLATRTP